MTLKMAHQYGAILGDMSFKSRVKEEPAMTTPPLQPLKKSEIYFSFSPLFFFPSQHKSKRNAMENS